MSCFCEKPYKLEGEILDIQIWPSLILTKKATPVTVFDDELMTLARNMLYTMYHAPGVGLAAPQVGVGKRMFVLDVDYERESIVLPNGQNSFKHINLNPQVFINPVLSNQQGDTIYEEGCLSVPGFYEEIHRSEKITVHYQNIKGQSCSLDADEMLAICIQHENDHLDGIVFLDHLSLLKKNIIKKKLLKDRKKIKM